MISDSRSVRRGSGVWELLDLATFDMQPLEEAFNNEQMRAGARRLVGVAVAVTNNSSCVTFARAVRVLHSVCRLPDQAGRR
jgi:hypothetical protein